MPKNIRIATRKSPLALWQARKVSELLKNIDNSINIELVKITTSGDKILDKPLYDIGGKSLFLKELEHALLENDCDIAVHSMKDMPAELHEDLTISAILEREDSRDVLISKKYHSLSDFTNTSSLGTSSVRRICNIKYEYPNIQIFVRAKATAETAAAIIPKLILSTSGLTVIKTPIKPPAIPIGVKAPEMICPNALGTLLMFAPITTNAASRYIPTMNGTILSVTDPILLIPPIITTATMAATAKPKNKLALGFVVPIISMN